MASGMSDPSKPSGRWIPSTGAQDWRTDKVTEERVQDYIKKSTQSETRQEPRERHTEDAGRDDGGHAQAGCHSAEHDGRRAASLQPEFGFI